jgi:2-dehydro-3-deoxyphosphooctonate aldolase (KDO 8-P synthase)
MYPILEHLHFTETGNFFLIAGPCVIEDETTPFLIAERLVGITERLGIPYAFKASYRKANRSRIDSFTGIGDQAGLDILKAIRDRFGIPVVTDIHSEQEAAAAAPYVDVLQIPAFLCRQTDLLVAAAKTGRTVNIKKAQFLSGQDMRYPVEKARDAGANEVWLTERGNSFGYNNLVVDFRNIPDMLDIVPTVIMDCTHSVQRPGSADGTTGGDRKFVPKMALAAKAFGATGYFFEVHPTPDEGLSDAANMLELDKLEALVEKLTK